MLHFKKELKPFQKIGAKFLYDRGHALLADEMGLGKTVQVLAAVYARKFKNVLTVCPASVRTGWADEIVECGLPLNNFSIISYTGACEGSSAQALLQSVVSRRGPFDCLILDEAHFLKTPDSQRTKAIFGNDTGLARTLAKGAFKWALTGSPVLNRPRELHPILSTMAPEVIHPYSSYSAYTQKFCGAYWEGPGRGMNTKGATNLDELGRRLVPFMLRRTKKMVAPELPPRIVSKPTIELTREEMGPILALESEIANREAYLSPTMEDFSQLGDMAKLLRATGIAKAPKIAAFVDEMLETVDKVVVFAHHKDVIAYLDKALGHYLPVSYHGGMNDEQKKAAVEEFTGNKNCQVFIGQLQAAGTGINGLQRVSANVVFAELSWVPGTMAQAIDRVHRFGQAASAVNVYMPHVPGTLESAVLQVQMGKQANIDRIMGQVEDRYAELEGLI